MTFAIVAAVALLGLYMAWTIGANDFANSMGAAVGSRAVSIRKAIVLGALCEVAGSVLVGSHVTDTVRKGIISPEAIAAACCAEEPESSSGSAPAASVPADGRETAVRAAALCALGMTCALIAAAVWLHLATWLSMPVSTTHSIVGAVAGFGIVAAGWHAVEWGKMGQIVASWFVSPVAGGLLAYTVFKLISRFILGRSAPVLAAIRTAPVSVFTVACVVFFSILYKGGLQKYVGDLWWLRGERVLVVVLVLSAGAAWIARFFIARYLREADGQPLVDQLHRVERVFAPLVVISSSSVAFAHGANDVANAMGPVAAVVDVVRSGSTAMGAVVPLWILLLGGLGIVLGLATYGRRVMHTIGTRITQLTPSRGIAADLSVCTTVLVCSRLGLPVSTTHTIVGAIIGVGFARGLGAINRRVVRDIVGSWVVTVPASAVLAITAIVLLRLVGTLGFIEEAIRGAGGRL
jgi:PiT family inorganic phosphate transporter